MGSNCAQKYSVNSVCSVREKTPQRFVSVLYHTVVAFYFSQKNTEEQNTQIFTETLSQPISQNLTANRSLTPSPSPNGEGSDHRDTPVGSGPSPFPSPEGKGSDHRDTPICPPFDSDVFSSYQQSGRGNLTYYSPLHSERGRG